jgi:hypothetical protein
MRNQGRIVGLIYLFLVLVAPLRLVFVPGKLFVYDNAEATDLVALGADCLLIPFHSSSSGR